MKKLLFVINNLNIGGIQRSLVDLLSLIAKDYDITLYCLDKRGAFSSQMPQSVKVIEASKLMRVAEYDYRKCKENLGLFYAFLRIVLSVFSKKFGRKWPCRILNKISGRVPGQYDFAISFSQPLYYKDLFNVTNEIVLDNVHAFTKIVFIHCDYAAYGGDCEYNRGLLHRFDKIVCVSESVKSRFCEILPEEIKKTFVLYNFCMINQIREMANEDPVIYDRPTLVSVSRLTGEKGLPRCISIIKRLSEMKLTFQWVIVGDGPLRKDMEEAIKQDGLNNYIKLVGAKSNPYRYMKNAVCLFLPSYHEAAPMVFNEATCLKIPIITTNTLSACEIVEKRNWGVVCDNNDESIFQALFCFLKDGYNYLPKINIEEVGDLVIKQFKEIIN